MTSARGSRSCSGWGEVPVEDEVVAELPEAAMGRISRRTLKYKSQQCLDENSSLEKRGDLLQRAFDGRKGCCAPTETGEFPFSGKAGNFSFNARIFFLFLETQVYSGISVIRPSRDSKIWT